MGSPIIPQPFVHGPGHIFVGVGSSYAPFYLGTAKLTPRIQIQPAFTPYYNSVFSPRVPMDMVQQGEEAFVSAQVNRWAEGVYGAIASRPNAAGTRGLILAGELGTCMIFEGMAYPLWVQFPYSSKPAMATGGMPGGYRFYNAMLVGPDTLEPISMDPSERTLTWHCLPTLAVGANNTTIARLYDHDMTGLPAVL